MTPFPNKIEKGQAKKTLREISYVSHANNLGFQDISVQRGRHTTLKLSLKMKKRGRRRRNQNLHPKKRGMKKKKLSHS